MARLHHANDLRRVLDDDAAGQIWEALTQENALVTESTSNINKQNRVFVALLSDDLLEWERVEPCWEPGSTEMNPLHEEPKVVGIAL